MYQSPQWILHELRLSEPVWLRRETNDFDVNAISVETREGRRLGYIGRTVAARLSTYMDTKGEPVKAVVTELTRDVSGGVVGMAVSLYLPVQLAREIRGKATDWSSCCDAGFAGATYLFLECDEAQLDQVNETLRRHALPWCRSGLSYRAAPDGRQYRWYVRLDGEVSQAALQQIIEDTLGPSSRDSVSSQALDDWISQFDLENRRLIDQSTFADERNTALEQENSALRNQLSVLQADLERWANSTARRSRSMQRREMGDAIRVLLPDMHLLRDSLDVITQELESFEPVLHELHSLCSDPANVKGERVEGASQWRERRFSTGQKHDGRLYFRHDDSAWCVLVSFKDSQKQDIEYLRNR